MESDPLDKPEIKTEAPCTLDLGPLRRFSEIEAIPPQYRRRWKTKRESGSFLKEKKKEAVAGLIFAAAGLISVGVSAGHTSIALIVFIFVYPAFAFAYFWFIGSESLATLGDFLSTFAALAVFIPFCLIAGVAAWALITTLVGGELVLAGLAGILVWGSIWLGVFLARYIAGAVLRLFKGLIPRDGYATPKRQK